jgi:hypothetical protein
MDIDTILTLDPVTVSIRDYARVCHEYNTLSYVYRTDDVTGHPKALRKWRLSEFLDRVIHIHHNDVAWRNTIPRAMKEEPIHQVCEAKIRHLEEDNRRRTFITNRLVHKIWMEDPVVSIRNLFNPSWGVENQNLVRNEVERNKGVLKPLLTTDAGILSIIQSFLKNV